MTERTRPPVMFRNGGLAVQTPFSFVLSVLFCSKVFGGIIVKQVFVCEPRSLALTGPGPHVVVRDCRVQRLTVLTRSKLASVRG